MAHIIPLLPDLSPISAPVKNETELPPTLNLSMLDSQNDETESKTGGRPQSEIRKWFIGHYKDATLTGHALTARKNIKEYECPACHLGGIDPWHIDGLKDHVRKCDLFPKRHKGICMSYIYPTPTAGPYAPLPTAGP